MSVTIRSATHDDAAFLAEVALRAARSHVARGIWDFLVPDDDAKRMACIEAALLGERRSWCHWANFVVAEVDGERAAALSGYPATDTSAEPMEETLKRSLAAIGFDEAAIGQAFRRALFFLSCHVADEPDAWIVEWVATLPRFQRRGLVRALLGEILERGRAAGHPRAQIGILMGNHVAQKAYEDVGFELAFERASPEFEAEMGCPGLARLLLDFPKPACS